MMSRYEAQTYKPNIFAQPNRQQSFAVLHESKVNDFFKQHMREVRNSEE